MKRILFIASVALLSLQTVQAENEIIIEDAWIREAPPTINVLAGYLTIKNTADTDLMLTKADSTSFRKIELHRTTEKDGVAKMRRIDKLTILAHSEETFKPGGLHLMLFDPVTPLKKGDQVGIQLHFDQSKKINV
ncbi:MAG: copper chaperone PCu(A)C, partial [Gammaproteobacteria bacterium]|nr:copper chaperone PCu(A)C [Gammaproteobacteria bacterium]